MNLELVFLNLTVLKIMRAQDSQEEAAVSLGNSEVPILKGK
jgi:hypothetical protein